MTLNNLVARAGKMASDNSPLILTAIGCVGTVTTAVLASKATIKAVDIIAQEQLRLDLTSPQERAYQLDNKDRVLLVWKEFMPAIVSGVGTITCIICANRIGTRRAAAMAAAYSLSERAFVEYKDKVVEQIGKNKEQKVRDEVMQDRMTRDRVDAQEIFATGGGGDLCYEKFTARYFYSSMENIKHAQNRVNHDINNGVYASLSDFYDYLGLDHTGVSDELGWNGDHLMDITFSTTLADGNRPCIAFDYRVEPVRNYFRIH